MNLYELASLGMEADAQPLYRPAPRAMAADAGDIAGPPTRAFAVPQALDPLFEAAAADYGVDASILKGIAHAESRFRPDIISGHTRSRTGALGLMQFMPDTARELGIDPLDPVQSVFGAAAYLRESLDRFGGDTERAIASYNWGRNRTAFDRDDWYKALPAETRNYVGAVLDFADGAVPTPGPAALLHGTKVPLPEGVQPSQAGGGRGMVNPPAQRSEAVAGPNASKKGVFERVGGELAQLRDEFFSGAAGVSANFQAMNASAAANQLLQRQDALKKLEQAGKGESAEALGLRKYITHATARLGGMAADAADAGALADAAGRMTTRPELRAVSDAKSFGESWEAFKKDPYAVVAGVTAQSLPQMIPMIVAAATTGPVGGAAVAGGTSALTEFGSGIREFARDNGVDPSDKEGLGKLFSDPKMLREAMAYAGKGGAIVGTMDAVSGGLAGKTLVPKVFKNQAVRQAINAPLQAGVQAALGGAGEAGKQLAQKGQIDQPGQVLAEVVGELGGVHNPLQDTSARVADDGGRRAVDPPAPRVPAQTTAPAAPVGQPSTAAPNLDANGLRTVDSHSVEGGTHVLPDRHLDVSEAPTVPYAGVGTVAQLAEATGGQQTLATAADMHASGPQGGTALDSPADVSVAPFVGAMRLTDEGTLSVEGDPRALEAFLNKAGVDKVFLFDRSLLVAPEQAAQAQQALSPDAANALKRQPPPVQMTMREGGMLGVEGDTQAVRQWLEGAGIPKGAMMDGPGKVVVTAGSVERAKQALAAPAPLPTAQTTDHEDQVVPVQDARSTTARPAPMVATKLEAGALKIKGDPKKILAVLRNGGVTNVKVRKKEVTVWANEAALAQEILADNNLAGDPAGTETATANNGVKEFDGAGPGAAADDFSNLGLSDLGSKLGEGGTKDVFAYGEKYAVGVLHSGRISELESELKLLGQLKEMGLPVVNARGPIMVGDRPALVYDRFEAGTKDAVRMVDGHATVVGDLSLLNKRSISDLILIRGKIEGAKLHISDLQFLVGKDGGIVISDPLRLAVGDVGYRKNIKMIDYLVKLAEGK